MFPNNVSFIARERDKERYQEAEQVRLIKIAKLHQGNGGGMLRKAANWLGSHRVRLGTRLQSHDPAPLLEVNSVETLS
jgi:hypothetical protein